MMCKTCRLRPQQSDLGGRCYSCWLAKLERWREVRRTFWTGVLVVLGIGVGLGLFSRWP